MFRKDNLSQYIWILSISCNMISNVYKKVSYCSGTLFLCWLVSPRRQPPGQQPAHRGRQPGAQADPRSPPLHRRWKIDAVQPAPQPHGGSENQVWSWQSQHAVGVNLSKKFCGNFHNIQKRHLPSPHVGYSISTLSNSNVCQPRSFDGWF